MSKFLYILFWISLICFSCKDDDLTLVKESELYCEENIVFSCNSIPTGDTYFKGKINCRGFCVSIPNDGYYSSDGVATSFTTPTSNPVLNSNVPINSTMYSLSISAPIFDNYIGITKDFEPSIQIFSPSIEFDSIVPDPIFFMDKFFQEGDLVMQSHSNISNIGAFDGWSFSISWSCVLLPGYDYYKKRDETYIPSTAGYLSPTQGRQDDLVFRLNEIKLERVGNISTYYLTFEIECDLYYGGDQEYYGRLEDGVFKTKVVIED